MDKKLCIAISKDAFKAKPSTDEIRFVLSKGRNYQEYQLTPEDLLKAVLGGRSFRGCVFDKDEKNPKQSVAKVHSLGNTVLPFDFDGVTQTPQEMCDILTNMWCKPNFWYYSFSNADSVARGAGYRYRVVWCFDEMLTPREYEGLYNILIRDVQKLGIEVDKGVTDTARLWHGTNSKGELIRADYVTRAEMGWAKIVDKLNSGKTLYNVMRSQDKDIVAYFNAEQFDSSKCITVEKGWYEQLRGRCDLWDMWEKGEYIDYNSRLKLFTNLKYLKHTDSETSVLDDVLSFYNPTTYETHTCDEKQITDLFTNKKLYALPIVDRKIYTVANYLSLKRTERGGIISSLDKISLEQLDEQMDRTFPKVLESNHNNYVVCQTASGKTKRIIDWLCEQDLSTKRIVYAAPTYALIEELEQRFKDTFIKTTKSFGETQYPLHTVAKGVYDSSLDMRLLKIGAKPVSSNKERACDIKALMGDEWHGVYFITHALLANLQDFDFDIIIIDENIESTLIKDVDYSFDKLSALQLYLPTPSAARLNDFILSARSQETNSKVDLKPLAKIIEQLDIEDYVTNCDTLCDDLFYCNKDNVVARIDNKKHIYFTIKSNMFEIALNNGTPIKMFTASTNLSLLKKKLGVDLDKVQFEMAQNKGKVVQFAKETGAKGENLEKIPKLITYIKKSLPQEIIDKAYVLTFKDAVDEFSAAGFNIPTFDDGSLMNITNSEGVDKLKGETVIVAGKFDLNADYYNKIYFADNDTDNLEPPSRNNHVIDLNGYRQKLYLYDDDELRAIQIEIIEKNLVQAVGRARALRCEDATVYLFTNFSIADVDEKINY